MKGDRVEIVIDSGGGTKNYEIAATKAGRRVDIANRRGIIEVSEVTRTGTPVRTARFMASRVVALVEYPADSIPSSSAPSSVSHTLRLRRQRRQPRRNVQSRLVDPRRPRRRTSKSSAPPREKKYAAGARGSV